MTGYLSPLSQRYASEEMQRLWGARHRAGLWRRLWLALAESQRGLGLAISDLASEAKSVAGVRLFEERYPNGRPRIRWHGGAADDGRFLLHGTETWFYDNGIRQREGTYRLGVKSGLESYWSPDGLLLWSWEYREDGSATWRQYWPGGALKAESSWNSFRAHGSAKLWSASGELQRTLVSHWAHSEVTEAWEAIAIPENGAGSGYGYGTGDGNGFGDGRSLSVFALVRGRRSALPAPGEPLGT